jgi:stearoyl-CoA desaturase (delta-9 desaturase)
MFGSREYATGDHSKNNLLFGLLAHGEGWHNNHHAFPTSARHGLRWWQFDLSWIIIRTMELLGLAWKVRRPGARALEAKRLPQ